jgi:hypothetical protein
MAVVASAAQAEGHFAIDGTPITANESVEGEGGLGKLLVPGFGLTLHCTSSKIKGTIQPGGTATALVLFHGCSVEGNKFCTVYPTEKDLEKETTPKLIHATGTGYLYLHEGQHYLIVKGLGEAEEFSNIYLGGPGCPLPEVNEVTGLTAFLLPDALEKKVNHSITAATAEDEALLEELGVVLDLKYGGEPALLDEGTATNLHLTGANQGEPWSAL